MAMSKFGWTVAGLVAGLGLPSFAIAAGGGLGRGASVRERPTNDFGHEFVRIGRPGNRAALPEERYYNIGFEDLGRVNHRYRMARTEVTATQWLDFVNAYWPYWEAAGGHPEESHFISQWLNTTTNQPGVDPGYYINAGAEQRAIETTWRLAATYCNWLHNGRVEEEWAFQSGAYDTSTFGGNSQEGYTDQAERSPGARFWLPSVDEWVKAAHYDPNRYGVGLEGYWLRMNGQEEPLTPGLPENGGETSAGDFLPGFQEQFLDVGLYTDIDAPWGLLDTSGSVQEWTETVRFFNSDGTHGGTRYIRGSFAGDDTYGLRDIVDWASGAGGPASSTYGIRLASAIPAPGGVMMAFPLLIALARQRQGQSRQHS